MMTLMAALYIIAGIFGGLALVACFGIGGANVTRERGWELPYWPAVALLAIGAFLAIAATLVGVKW